MKIFDKFGIESDNNNSRIPKLSFWYYNFSSKLIIIVESIEDTCIFFFFFLKSTVNQPTFLSNLLTTPLMIELFHLQCFIFFSIFFFS